MVMKRYRIGLILALTLLIAIFAPITPRAEPLSPAEAVEDAEFLHDRIELVHPNPYFAFDRKKMLGDRTIVHKNGFRKPPARSNRFDGNLFVLTGPMTFSTAADFAALIKDLEVGKIVGGETGGLASSYGDVFSCELPNSGLRLGISYKYFLRPGGFDDGRGVIPDIPIDSNPVKRVRGKNVVLENLLKTIEKNHEVTQ